MSSRFVKIGFWITLALGLSLLIPGLPSVASVRAQQPTGSIPTVTGTVSGPFITVNLDQDFVNVRSGPSQYFYPKIGVLLRGQIAPALGRSPDGSWIQIYYPGVPGDVGWIYAPVVSLSSAGFLSILEPPPTPTSLATPTINPTLQAAFTTPQLPTRLPTFTPAAPVAAPVFSDETANASRIPLGLLIFSLGFIGMFVAVISFLRGR
jgi:hypothetical protein